MFTSPCEVKFPFCPDKLEAEIKISFPEFKLIFPLDIILELTIVVLSCPTVSTLEDKRPEDV